LAFGALLLFVYALGHSVLILAAGTSMGFAKRVLESRRISRATDLLRRCAGGVIVLIGLFFVHQALTK
jgi:cytochrome c biogenesis protein CcdA